MIPVPSFTRLVWAAAKVSATAGSSIRPSGATGDGGTCGSGSTTCSPVHTESYPASSATLATRTRFSGCEQTKLLMLNSPTATIGPR